MHGNTIKIMVINTNNGQGLQTRGDKWGFIYCLKIQGGYLSKLISQAMHLHTMESLDFMVA